MRNTVSKDVAIAEVDKFLFETKQIDKDKLLKREYGDFVFADYAALINSVASGHFYFKDDKIVQVLDFAVGKDIKEIMYNPRLKVRDMRNLAAFDFNDVEGRKAQVISSLTNQAIGVILDMDSNDFERSKRLIEFYFLG
jgi:hypothetical protein